MRAENKPEDYHTGAEDEAMDGTKIEREIINERGRCVRRTNGEMSLCWVKIQKSAMNPEAYEIQIWSLTREIFGER